MQIAITTPLNYYEDIPIHKEKYFLKIIYYNHKIIKTNTNQINQRNHHFLWILL